MRRPHDFSALEASRQKALAALLSCETVASAARNANLNEATLYRYLQDPAFKAAYRRALADIVEHAMAQLQRDCASASRALREVCGDSRSPPHARVAAARAILDSSLKAVQLGEQSERIAELEKRLNPEGRQ